MNPKNAYAYFDRAGIHIDKAEWEKALSDLNTAISLNSKDASYYYNRGYTYENLGKLSEALSDYETALNMNPNYESRLKDKIEELKQKLTENKEDNTKN